jgi:Ca2+-transporting ATPase
MVPKRGSRTAPADGADVEPIAPFDPAGLTPEAAERLLARHGPNRLAEPERWRWLKDAARLVADPMALMLGGAGAAYLLLGETRDGIILLLAIVPVLAVDVLLEVRSRGALKKLAAAVRPVVRVRRGGVEREISGEALVPGDALLLREGDIVLADGAVRQAANLALDESSLTGESEPVEKLTHTGAPGAAAPPRAQVFAGSVVLTGQGLCEVTATGAATRFGKIAQLVAQSSPEPTPLQRNTSAMVRRLGLVALLVAATVFGLGWWRGQDPWRALLAALSIAISAVPEEFPLVFTIFLTMGAWRLSRAGVLVRRLAAVETLGATTVICTDKTGTLTTGQFALENHLVLAEGVAETDLLTAAVLACERDPGDAMERAVLARAAAHGVDPASLLGGWVLTHDHDFDPLGKHMSHGWRAAGDGAWRLCAKGALEGILQHCALAPGERERAEAAHAGLAGRGMRVLAVAERRGVPLTGRRDEDERELRLLGLLGFRDPLRPQVPAAVAECGRAGIRLKIITGDHALTAHAIAEAAGIPHSDDAIVTGEELDLLAPEPRAARIRSAAILARVRPEQKHEIVEVLSRAGEVVAMTGDGINDAPALRRADIGISFGRRGTEVARAAADLILLDDDFSALVATIREGRTIFTNLQRAFLFLVSFKLRIVALALLPPLLGWPAFFMPVHLVWLELVVHPISALAFEAEPPPADLMRRPPRHPKAPLLPRRLLWRSLLSGLLLTAAALWAYLGHLGAGVAYARSLGVAVVVAGSLAQVWAERAGEGSLLSTPWPRSGRFWLVFGGVALSLPLFVHVPAIATVFQLAPLAAADWALVVGLAVGSVAWRALPLGRPAGGAAVREDRAAPRPPGSRA